MSAGNNNRETEGKSLLRMHKDLEEILQKIPSSRNMVYREEMINANRIGKPRFIPKDYPWPGEVFAKLRDFLEMVWLYFDKYSFWFDDEMRALLEFDQRRASKKSVLFLLERDVWGTEEVFGDYLIEARGTNLNISYFRREQRRRTFRVVLQPRETVETWIQCDAIRQIQDQFSYLWSKLQGEIEACMEETFHPLSQVPLNLTYIKDQYQKTVHVLKDFPEAAMLSLGRLAEIWLLILLQLPEKDENSYLMRQAHLRGLIDQSQVKFLNKIRVNYNHLKHNATWRIDSALVAELVDQFMNMIPL